MAKMKIVKINFQNPEPKIIKTASLVIKNGGILVYPTDTCYGLGADPRNPKAIDNLLKLKERSISKNISVVVRDFLMLKKICEVNSRQEQILKTYLPGPYTFILNKKSSCRLKYYGSEKTLGIRIPDCVITQVLSKELDFPYTTTSANLSGKKECYDVSCILEQFKNKKIQPNLILDAGRLPSRLSSTVVDLTSFPPRVLRRGSGKWGRRDLHSHGLAPIGF